MCVLDVGGGEATLVDVLLARGLDCVRVLDVSGEAIEHARARLGAAAHIVNWIEADVVGSWDCEPVDIWHVPRRLPFPGVCRRTGRVQSSPAIHPQTRREGHHRDLCARWPGHVQWSAGVALLSGDSRARTGRRLHARGRAAAHSRHALGAHRKPFSSRGSDASRRTPSLNCEDISYAWPSGRKSGVDADASGCHSARACPC